MSPINKSEGTTESERFLGRLGDDTFLSLWSYPNVYRDKGKEFCDLLVVCGNNVLIFSDKSIGWPSNLALRLSWSRWYRRAIQKSAKQIERASAWIQKHPDRLFLDPQCTVRFPIDLPSPNNLNIHHIIVARGAADACLHHFKGGSGGLILNPSAPLDDDGAPSALFTIGNPSTDGRFYHVFDEVSLAVILRELDTISDLCAYLQSKERLIKAEQLVTSPAEEDLLAVYLRDVNDRGEHDFVVESRKPLKENQFIGISEGSYNHYRNRSEYRRKLQANKVSYLWDRLIERFAVNIIKGVSYQVRGFEEYYEPSKRELGLRYMALEDRFARRMHSEAILGAFEKIGNMDRMFRAMLPGPTSNDQTTAFFVLLMKRDTLLSSESDEDYRIIRGNNLYAYAFALLRNYSNLKRVVGIATEGERDRLTRSEDMIYAEQPAWSDSFLNHMEESWRDFGVFKNGPPSGENYFHMRPLEYPPSHHTKGSRSARTPYFFHQAQKLGNRHERRKAKAERRRKRYN